MLAAPLAGAGDDAGLNMAGTLVTLELVLLSEGFRRLPYYDVPLALLSLGGGVVFARFLERSL